MKSIAKKFQIDFTDEAITASGGSIFLQAMAEKLGLREKLRGALRLKQRRRGASDEEMLLSLIYSLAQSDGNLVDVDRLRVDEARRQMLGLEQVPDSRRLGEYLFKFDPEAVERLREVARELATSVGQQVAEAEQGAGGFAPVFIDGTAVEVSGQYFEGAKAGYNDQPQYWLHSVLVGRLWASQRLQPGGVGVTLGWREQLQEVEPLLRGRQVWLRADNAYYNRQVVDYCRQRGWDYSISVTHEKFKKPLREEVRSLSQDDWQWINDDRTEEAAIIYHQPHGWKALESYVVVRSWWDGAQRRLYPRYIFILVSRTDLELAELVRRHRGKQGQENAQKGPLIDLDLHHPPCSLLCANQAFYTAAQIAQILLCAVQYNILPEAARCHGIRTIIRDLVRAPARLVRHGRGWIVRFAKTVLRLDWLVYAAFRLDELCAAPS